MSLKAIAAVLGMTMVLGTAVKADDTVSIDVSADIFGKYIWRGQELNKSSVFQPGIDVSYAGFTGTVWGNLDLTGKNGERGEFTEYNYAIDYTMAVPGIDGVDFSVGAIYYYFPSTDPSSTTEIYWGLGFDVLLNPYVTVYHDIDEVKGTYVLVGVEHRFDSLFSLSPEMPVDAVIGAGVGWGSAGYNDAYWGYNNSKLNDLTLSLAFPIKVGGWTIAPSINYVTLLSDSVRATNSGGQKNESLFAGIGLSTSF